MELVKKTVYETISPDLENECDSIEVREEVLKIKKSLDENGQVLHQKKVCEQKLSTKTSKSYVPLIKRGLESISDLDDQEEVSNQNERPEEDSFQSQQVYRSQELVQSQGNSMMQSINYNAPVSDMSSSNVHTPQQMMPQMEATPIFNQQQQAPATWQTAAEASTRSPIELKRMQAESLVDQLEQRLQTMLPSNQSSQTCAQLRSVLGQMIGTKNQTSSQRGNLQQPITSSNKYNSSINYSYDPSQTGPYQQQHHQYQYQYQQQQQFASSNYQAQPQTHYQNNVHSHSGYNQTPSHSQTMNPSHYYNTQGQAYNQQHQASENQYSSAQVPNIRISSSELGKQSETSKSAQIGYNPPDLAQTAPVQQNKKGEQTQQLLKPKQHAQTEVKKAKKSKKDINPREYLLDLNKSLKYAITAHIDETFTSDIMQQMARRRKRLVPLKIEGTVATDGKEQIKVSQKNHFMENCTSKYLHYFMPYTKNLFLLNLSKNVDYSSTNKDLFQKIDLDIDFNLSPYLKSVITPTGMIFLVAGKTEENASTIDDSLGTCHLYHYGSQTLVEKANMSSFKRKKFGLVYFNKNLFVVGGIVQGQLTNACERYDVRTNEWVPIASMSKAVEDVSLCTYGNRYIFRFFGIDGKRNIDQSIERFDAIRNRWQTMNASIKTSIRDAYLPVCCQVSTEYILILGGKSLKGAEATKGHAYLVKLEEKKGSLNLEVLKTDSPIPKLSAILNSSALFIENNAIYTIKEGKHYFVIDLILFVELQ